MNVVTGARRALGWVGAGTGVVAATYLGVVATTWFRYGRPAPARPGEDDPLLDCFMPEYEVAERHHVHVAARAGVTLVAAIEANMRQAPLVRAIFRARELVLGAEPPSPTQPKGLLQETQALGWRILAQIPDREVVVGAITQPWHANVEFHGLAPDTFRSFHEPGYAKIAWTLRADPVDDGRSVFRTETRVTTTDADARARFRWYWARFSPGIVLIRRVLLLQVKADAERRARTASTAAATSCQ